MTSQKWLLVSIINLSLIAFIGIILRYKIAFSLPFVDQKHLLHGHSHFAFAGWVTQLLMVLMVAYLSQQTHRDFLEKYKWLLSANLITAYGMLIAFIIQGYGLFSITFSTLSIFVSYGFAFVFWKDLNKIQNQESHLWFKASLIFSVVSSIGAFSLAFMMARHIIHQNWYLGAVYLFLHFQYNGWFLFSCMGLFLAFLQKFNIQHSGFRNIFLCFFFACFFTFFLSVLWVNIPNWVYLLIVSAAVIQAIAWAWLLKIFFNAQSVLKENLSFTGKFLLALAAIALSIKILLQVGSIYRPLNQLVFGFRPIVIGYLHLVFLGVISIFLIGYIVAAKFIVKNKKVITGIAIFVSGVFFNEILLMVQGISALNYKTLPFINESLLGAAIVIFSGVFTMILGLFQNDKSAF